MDDKKDPKQEDLGQIGSVEVEPLSDSDLESVAGGGPIIINSNVANACCPTVDPTLE